MAVALFLAFYRGVIYMFFRLRGFFYVNIAGFINLALWSALLTVYILIDRYNGSLNSELVLTGVYIFTSMIFLNTALFFIFKSIFFSYRKGPMVSYILSNLIVTFIFITNNMSVAVYGKQLGLEGMVMAFRGWKGGEMGNFTGTVIQVILVLAVYSFLFFAVYRILNRRLYGRPLLFNHFAVSVVLFTVVILFIHFRLVAMADTDWKMNSMKHKIPWQGITGFPEDLIRVDENGKKPGVFPALFTSPAKLDEKTELNQLRKMDAYGRKILSREIKVKKPYNILFINVEGLRHDMLNPENMPFLYRFVKEKAAALNKHYSTGNNTPGSLYGMFTGLAPYYFEPLRQNGFRNIPLEVLKKAGYRQSMYYNSPKNYEYIYDHILKNTEGKYVHAPGVHTDDYAPRDKWLFNYYIDELRRDKGTKRFDYILVNITHFNYYYPPEFRKYTPDYKSDFTIISGPQKGFKKDRVELMNRYKNSVYYADSLFKKLFTELEAMGRLKNTIIVLSGDHGEEFWEHGSFGHTWGLNDIQINPAAMIYYPGVGEDDIRYKYTSHQDFLPTVFDLIGVNVDRSYFMTGKSLVKYKPELDYVISSLGILVSFKRNGYAIMGNGYKILYRNNMDLNKSPYAIYDEHDKTVENFNIYSAADLLLKTSSSKRLRPPEF